MRKKALILVAVGAMLALLVIPAASQSRIYSPVWAAIKVESYGSGQSPTIELIDNVDSGKIDGENNETGEVAADLDNYNDLVVDFDIVGSPNGVTISSNQEYWFGDATDWVFKIRNNSGQNLDLDVRNEPAIPHTVTLTLDAVNDPDDTNDNDDQGNVIDDIVLTRLNASTLTNVDSSFEDGETITFCLVLKTDNAAANDRQDLSFTFVATGA